jgi:carbamoyl-phosphate synthase large subunit
MRAVTLNDKIPYYTTAAAAQAAVMAMVDRTDSEIKVRALQG